MCNRKLKIVGIYPEVRGLPPLSWMAEIGRLSEIPGVELKLTAGPDVRESQVAAALRDDSDVIIYSGHGRENGLLLPNQRIIKGRWIATQMKNKERIPRAIILAACGSGYADDNNESLTWQIAKAGISTIGMPSEVPDDAAIGYVVDFVRALIAGADIGEAHDVAIEAIEDGYPDEAKTIVLLPGLTNGYRFIIERLNRQDDRLGRLESGQERLMTMMESLINHGPAERRTDGARV